MVSVLVEKFSKNKRTMVLTTKPNYSLLQSSLKIDDLIDPRMNTVSSILKHVHKGTIESAYSILNGEYEVIEAEIIETSDLINKELKNADLPDEIKVGLVFTCLRTKLRLPSSKLIKNVSDFVSVPATNFVYLSLKLPFSSESIKVPTAAVTAGTMVPPKVVVKSLVPITVPLSNIVPASQ